MKDEKKMEIVNKVAQSGIITIDPEEFYIAGERIIFDLKNWLFEGLILKEKDFRERIADHDWNQYANKFVAVTCTADAIVPTWAFMVVAMRLQPYAAKVIYGDLKKLEEELFEEQVSKIRIEDFRDKRIVIKGCSGNTVPPSVYLHLTSMLLPVVKSIMYGEPCSTVPIYKRREKE